jgi:hypothetical protein
VLHCRFFYVLIAVHCAVLLQVIVKGGADVLKWAAKGSVCATSRQSEMASMSAAMKADKSAAIFARFS